MGGRKWEENKWAVENGRKINPGKRKVIRITRARGKNPFVTKKC